MNQTTISKPIKISGTGLHTGVPVNLRLKPAPENTGYIFVRTDLDNFEIPASVEYISHCSYATTLMRRGVVLSTGWMPTPPSGRGSLMNLRDSIIGTRVGPPAPERCLGTIRDSFPRPEPRGGG